MGLFNPNGIAEALRVQKFMKSKQLNLLQKSTYIEESKDKSKFIITMQFAFTTKEECEIFRDMSELAQKHSPISEVSP